MKSASSLPGTVALLCAASLGAQEASIAVRAGKVLGADGSVIENGTVVVVNGVFTAVGGEGQEVPFDVLLREFPDGVVFPGFYEAHSSSGMDRQNENVPIAPFLDVRDSIDPVSFYFEDELRGGTVGIGVIPGNDCVIGGRGRVVAPTGMTVEEMTLSPDLGMKLAIGPKSRWSRSAQLAELREAVDKLNDDLRRKGQALLDAREERSDLERVGEAPEDTAVKDPNLDTNGGFVRYGGDFPGKELISEADVDEVQRGLVEILNGQVRLWLWCPEPTDVVHGRDWAQQHGLLDQVVFVVGAASWKAAEVLAQAGRPVVLSGALWHVERDPVSWEERRTFAPKVFHDAGVEFSIGSNKSRLGPDRLSYQAAACVREGVPRAAALAAVSSRPAKAWGLDQRLGRIAPGFDGSFVVLSGDPLDLTSQVLEVYVRGKRVYERAKDERLQRLLEGESK